MDSSYFFAMLRLPLWSLTRLETRLNFSAGRRVSKSSVSTSTPRYVSLVVGPSDLSSASGMPSSSQVASSVSRALAHSSEPAWGTEHDEIIEVVVDVAYASVFQDPFQSISHRVENFWS